MINDRDDIDDIKDPKRDEERLSSDKASLDLPDVDDIPGQEHIRVAPLGEMADTTISSDDEEGEGLFDDEEEEDVIVVRGEDDEE